MFKALNKTGSWIVLFFSAKNVLLTAEGSRAKLADFDSAKRLTHELTEAGLKPLGTRGFAAPEVRSGIWEHGQVCHYHIIYFNLNLSSLFFFFFSFFFLYSFIPLAFFDEQA